MGGNAGCCCWDDVVVADGLVEDDDSSEEKAAVFWRVAKSGMILFFGVKNGPSSVSSIFMMCNLF